MELSDLREATKRKESKSIEMLESLSRLQIHEILPILGANLILESIDSSKALRKIDRRTTAMILPAGIVTSRVIDNKTDVPTLGFGAITAISLLALGEAYWKQKQKQKKAYLKS